MKGKRTLCLILCILLSGLGGGNASAVVELPGEIVSGDKVADGQELSPGAVSVINAKDLAGEHKDLPDLLERIPGLHVIRARGRGGYTVASVRGSTSSQVAVYVDGTLMNLGSEAAVDLSTIPVENISRVEVYRGYIPSRFGTAGLGGVINIVTKTPKKAETTISAGAGSYGLWRGGVSNTTPLGEGHLLSTAYFETSDGDFSYQNDNGTPFTAGDDYTGRREHNGYTNSDLLLKWEGKEWTARFSWLKNEKELAFPAPGSDKPNTPSGADLDTQRWELSLGQRRQSGNFLWGWRAEYLSQRKEYRDPNDGLGGYGEQYNQYESRRTSLGADASYSIGDRHFIEFFGDFSNEELDVTGDIVTQFQGISDFSQENWSLTLQDTIDLDGRGNLLLNPIIRWNKDRQDNQTTWAVGLTQKASRAWMFKGTYGTYSRAPNLYERFGDGATIRPNPKLKWEDGTQWDIGAHWSGKWGQVASKVGLTWFNRSSNNLIEYIQTNPRFGVYRNIGKADVKGVELEMLLDWENWSLSASGTWMDSENRTPGSYAEGKALPNRPEWEGFVRLNRAFKNSSAFIEAHYTGDNYFDDAQSIHFSNLLVWNIGVRYAIGDALKLSVGINDVLDQNPDATLKATGNGPDRMAWFPLQGRTLYTTLYWTF